MVKFSIKQAKSPTIRLFTSKLTVLYSTSFSCGFKFLKSHFTYKGDFNNETTLISKVEFIFKMEVES